MLTRCISRRGFELTRNVLRSDTNIVNIYSSLEWKEFNQTAHLLWPVRITTTSIRSKYFQLFTFFLEKKLLPGSKYYVMAMDLMPSHKMLKLSTLSPNCITTIYKPIDRIIPICYSDYEFVHKAKKFYTPVFLDHDMIYADHKTKEMFVFDKYGTWIKEGVEHSMLNLEITYDEKRWFDGFKGLEY